MRDIMTQMPALLDSTNIKVFLDSFDTVLTDCDGVLWTNATYQLIDRANEALNYLRSIGKKVFYVTNNSTKTRREFLAKFHALDFIADEDEIVSTAYVLAQHLKQKGFKKKVYVIGSSGIIKELDIAGIEHTDIGPDPSPGDIFSLQHTLTLDPDIGAVVIGFDGHFSFPKIIKAGTYLANPDVLFLACNTDENCPIPNTNLIYPGTGSLVRAVETVAERKAMVTGKPSPLMFEVISKAHSLDPQRTLMIGDRCNTDILFGNSSGLTTLLVLSGVTQLSHVKNWANSQDPKKHSLLADYYLPTLGSILDLV